MMSPSSVLTPMKRQGEMHEGSWIMSQSGKPALEEDHPAFLAGGGEMGERTRAFDWSKTPLGPGGEVVVTVEDNGVGIQVDDAAVNSF
jgi:hypothetical protein